MLMLCYNGKLSNKLTKADLCFSYWLEQLPTSQYKRWHFIECAYCQFQRLIKIFNKCHIKHSLEKSRPYVNSFVVMKSKDVQTVITKYNKSDCITFT